MTSFFNVDKLALDFHIDSRIVSNNLILTLMVLGNILGILVV